MQSISLRWQLSQAGRVSVHFEELGSVQNHHDGIYRVYLNLSRLTIKASAARLFCMSTESGISLLTRRNFPIVHPIHRGQFVGLIMVVGGGGGMSGVSCTSYESDESDESEEVYAYILCLQAMDKGGHHMVEGR
jgi:hypothetical protein